MIQPAKSYYYAMLADKCSCGRMLVEGAIIAPDDDQKLRWALLAVPSISCYRYRYQVNFKLIKH